jgi:hypothetical protein
MLRRSMLSLASVLTSLASPAAAQSLLIAHRPAPEFDPVLKTTSRLDYNVWSTGSDLATASRTRIQQGFIAHVSTLDSIEVNVSGGTTPIATVLGPTGIQVASIPMTVEDDTATALFEPGVPLKPGDFYTVRIQTATAAAFFGAKDNERYVFSEAEAIRPGTASTTDSLGFDLNMRIWGSAPFRPAAPAPTKRALLLLINNAGITLGGVQELRGSAPETTEEFGLKEFTGFTMEEVAKGISLATTGTSRGKYDKVVKCEDSQFTASNVLEALRSLDNYMVDIHVLSQGSEDSIVGYNNARLNTTNFFRPIEERRARGESINIRAVYQMNGFSGSLVLEWLAVGADVVNGTGDGKLNMMPPQYFGFLKHWMNGEGFGASVNAGFDEIQWFFDVLYAKKPSSISDSRMFIHGNDNLRFR